MKVHQQFARGVWNSSDPDHTCRRPIRPLAPKLHDTVVDLKSFIRAEGGDRRDDKKMNSPKDTATMRVTWQQGQGGTGMRWNPAPEQIGILERLYRGGMRTPNSEQIERITAQLSKYGKIEGKNVFYWFQNHKARERQKLKRTHSFASSTNSSEEQGSAKKKCVTTWAFDCLIPEETTKISTNANYLELQSENEEELVSKKTLELFPLHPEGINCNF